MEHIADKYNFWNEKKKSRGVIDSRWDPATEQFTKMKLYQKQQQNKAEMGKKEWEWTDQQETVQWCQLAWYT
jgi:hypothetical protein